MLLGPTPALAAPSAQGPVVVWTEPRVVWETAGRCSNPVLVTDAWGRVHLFFLSQEEGEVFSTLYYVEADNEEARPVDVQVGVSEFRVAADPYGMLHVLSSGANNLLHYTRAAATEAGRAAAWSELATLGSATLGSDIIADARGGLHLCYPRDHAVFHQSSADGGVSWSEARHVADMTDPEGVATYVRCAVDSEDLLHVAWAEARPPNFYPPEGVTYTRSKLTDAAWSEPEQVAGLHYTLPGLLADPRGVVHLLWQGDVAVGGRYYRQRPAGEADGWSATETVVPAGRGGMSGDSFLALDSRGDLHAGLNIDGAYWAVRRQAWSAPVDLSASLRESTASESSVEQATIAIANGNELFVGFEKGFKQIYLLRGQTDAPEVLRTPEAIAPAGPGLGGAEAQASPSASTEQAQPSVAPSATADLERLAEAVRGSGVGQRARLPVALGLLLAMLAVGLPLLRKRRSAR